ncbi:hypothetical protein [Glutamicibacter arilaitensis]|jgi:hypothetical protein|uniref:hypothetical protein n=2 Tax=Glutamicibacter TaxID=1742989 RepID=UPI003F8EFFB1
MPATEDRAACREAGLALREQMMRCTLAERVKVDYGELTTQEIPAPERNWKKTLD